MVLVRFNLASLPRRVVEGNTFYQVRVPSIHRINFVTARMVPTSGNMSLIGLYSGEKIERNSQCIGFIDSLKQVNASRFNEEKIIRQEFFVKEQSRSMALDGGRRDPIRVYMF
jgi:hypothetical protein